MKRLHEYYNELRKTLNLEDTLKELKDYFSLNALSHLVNSLDDKNELNENIIKHNLENTKNSNLYYLHYIFGTLQKCKICGNPCLSTYCSRKCAGNDPEIISRAKINREENNLKKYGVKNVMQTPEAKNKQEENNLKKYGVKSFFSTKEFQEKNKKTRLERYGDENYINTEKRDLTNLKRYGVKSFFSTKEFQEKSRKTKLQRYNDEKYVNLEKRKETNIERYGCESTFSSLIIQEKSKKTILERYHVDNPSKSEEIKEKKTQTYIKHYGVKNYNQLHLHNIDDLNIEFISEKFNGDPNALENFKEYFNCSDSFALGWLYRAGLREKGSCSLAEKQLFDFIPVENKIKRSRNLIKPYEIDIVIPDTKLAIEYNGSYFHSQEKIDKNYHIKKTDLCNERGYQLFHIFDFDDIEIWKSMILNKLHLNKVLYARKCEIREVSSRDSTLFLNENHLQGNVSASIRLGLFYDNELVEVMTFGKPRFNKNYDYELLRLCSKKYTSVVGGASKLFKYFISKYQGSIISYANRRFSQGKIYEVLGFSRVGISQPNYFYSNGRVVLTRYQCQKHKLKDFLEKFSSDLTESENMRINGYYKIYDSGNIVYGFKKDL